MRSIIGAALERIARFIDNFTPLQIHQPRRSGQQGEDDLDLEMTAALIQRTLCAIVANAADTFEAFCARVRMVCGPAGA
jgi:ATP-dependent protease ClpP protease subunit